MQVITCLFNTFSFIYILCNNYASLKTTTISVNCNNRFRQSFQEFKRLPLLCQHLKKTYEKILAL